MRSATSVAVLTVVLALTASCQASSEPPTPPPEPAAETTVETGAATPPEPASEPGPPPDAESALALPERFGHSMKGYTLYGWEREGHAWFTLITGTNRAKSFAELDDPARILGDDGWVRVRVAGVEAARDLLARVADGDFVMVAGVRSPTVAVSTVPDDVRDPDPAVLAALR